MKKLVCGLGLMAAIAAAAPAFAQGASHSMHSGPHAATGTTKAGTLIIERPWSRATPGGAKVAGGYVRITNAGSEPDRLLGGTFAQAGRVQVHEMSEADGVMKMRELAEGLEIAPGATVELKPGSYHLMFLDLKGPLKQGQVVPGTLRFGRAGAVPVSFEVQSIGAQGPGEGMNHKH